LQWAAALKKIQRDSNNSQKLPVLTQEKNIKEAMFFYAKNLRENCKKKNFDGSENTLRKLIALRAKQVVILLQKIKAKKGKVSQNAVDEAVKKYYSDCQKLITSASLLLEA